METLDFKKMQNSLSNANGFKQMEELKEKKLSAWDYQSSAMLQDIIPFLKEAEQKINQLENEVERLSNRVQQLDSFHNG